MKKTTTPGLGRTLPKAIFMSILGLPILLAAPSEARAEAPPEVSIRAIVSGGSGCPTGPVEAYLSPDRERLFVRDGTLTARAAPGLLLSERRAFCQLVIDLAHSPGYAYALTNDVGYRGYVELDDGLTATIEVERYFQGDLPSAPVHAVELRGPLFRQYFVSRESPEAIGPFSECDSPRALNVRTEVRVSALDNPSGAGSIQISPAYGIEVFRLHWRRCP